MKKSILKQYRYLQKEIPDLEKRIDKLEQDLIKLENSDNVVDTVTGGEGGIQHFKIEGFPSRDYSKKKSLLLSKKIMYEKCKSELDDIILQANAFINLIQDSRMRMICRYYYEDGLSQQEIAMKMHMDQATVSRELEKISKL